MAASPQGGAGGSRSPEKSVTVTIIELASREPLLYSFSIMLQARGDSRVVLRAAVASKPHHLLFFFFLILFLWARVGIPLSFLFCSTHPSGPDRPAAWFWSEEGPVVIPWGPSATAGGGLPLASPLHPLAATPSYFGSATEEAWLHVSSLSLPS